AEQEPFEAADEPGLGRRWGRVGRAFFRQTVQRKRSVRTVTVRSIARQPPGIGTNSGLCPVTSSTTCWKSASFQTNRVRVAPNGPRLARAAASASATAVAGLGDSATCWAALAAALVRVDVAYKRTRNWAENNNNVRKMLNPTSVPTMAVPCWSASLP